MISIFNASEHKYEQKRAAAIVLFMGVVSVKIRFQRDNRLVLLS